MKTKPSEDAKNAGLDSMKEAANIVGKPVQTLINWHKSMPMLFEAVIAGCVVIKMRKSDATCVHDN